MAGMCMFLKSVVSIDAEEISFNLLVGSSVPHRKSSLQYDYGLANHFIAVCFPTGLAGQSRHVIRCFICQKI